MMGCERDIDHYYKFMEYCMNLKKVEENKSPSNFIEEIKIRVEKYKEEFKELDWDYAELLVEKMIIRTNIEEGDDNASIANGISFWTLLMSIGIFCGTVMTGIESKKVDIQVVKLIGMFCISCAIVFCVGMVIMNFYKRKSKNKKLKMIDNEIAIILEKCRRGEELNKNIKMC